MNRIAARLFALSLAASSAAYADDCTRHIYNTSAKPWVVVVKPTANGAVFLDGARCQLDDVPYKYRDQTKLTNCRVIPAGGNVLIQYANFPSVRTAGTLVFMDYYGVLMDRIMVNMSANPAGESRYANHQYISHVKLYGGCPVIEPIAPMSDAVVMNQYPGSQKRTEGDATIVKNFLKPF